MLFFRFLVLILLTSHTAMAQISAPPAAWSYDGEGNNQHEWGLLSPDYAACEMGSSQSPIKITYTKTIKPSKLFFSYQNTKATLLNDGHMLRTEPAVQMSFTLGNQTYVLRHMTFHSPSEHMIGDTYYGLEIQFLHESNNGEKLMLAVFANTGAEHAELKNLLANGEVRAHTQTEVTFNPAKLLPEKMGYYSYSGSLPYPPCKEGVRWIIFKDPIEISQTQLAVIGESTGRNARLTQPAFMRTVEETKE